jgi:glycerophosphoryl diester phosphodiesterase
MPTPRLYAHRGASRELPENTLPAFRRALAIGVDALETDAHVTRDGHVVLSHDPTCERAAGITRPIRHATLAEVRRWDVGRRFRAVRPEIGDAPFTVPTLEELLAETPGVPINVDIKQHDDRAARAVVEVLRAMKAQDRVLVTSFDPGTLRAVRELGYEGRTGLDRNELLALALLPAPLAARLRPIGRATQVPRRAGPLVLDRRSFLDKSHALGLPVEFWTVNDPTEAERLLELGADGIMTDDPAALVPVFDRFRQRHRVRSGRP